MTDLSQHACTRDQLVAALTAAAYDPPHAALYQLPEPCYVIAGDAQMSTLELPTSTLLVTGDLTVAGTIDLQQTGRPLGNLMVVGDCKLQLGYVDGFLCVGGTLEIGTLIADSNWSGGIFVGGDLVGDTLIVNDIGVEVDGEERITHEIGCDDLDRARSIPGLVVADKLAPRALYLELAKARHVPPPR